jgi:protein-S-isoprenylcysteine O-methyltransferase Ste14
MSLTIAWKVLYYFWFAVEFYVLFLTRTRSTKDAGGKSPDRGSLMVLWVVIFCSIFAASWIAAAHSSTVISDADWMRPAALVVLAVGLAIRVTAIYTLGRSFTANVNVSDTQKLHEVGLFRYMRHPSYAGMLLIFTALGLRMQNWLSLLLTVVPPVCALLYRIHVEEAALTRAFGDQYVSYSERTKRLIPGIY